jgi:hypothetical protein
VQSLMIVGADHLGNIPKKLEGIGYNDIVHVNGRKSQMVKYKIPEHVDVILILTDYINHNLSSVIKQKAKDIGIPIRFAKRSWSSIHQELTTTTLH